MLMDIISISIDAITCIGVYIAIRSFLLTKRATIVEYERTNKLDTFNILKEYETKFHQYNDVIYKKCGNEVLNYNIIIEDKELEKIVRDYLNDLEFISTGINIGIYDINTTERLFGDIFVRRFYQFFSYIEERRKQRNTKIVFAEFEKVVKAIEIIKENSKDLLNKKS